MRRSQAPSIRKAVKRGLPTAELEPPRQICAPSEMQWGTVGGYKSYGPRRYNEGENPLKDKRIFLVLWRPQSNKKHKTWKGNGTLEVTATRATLRDETNKVLDVLTCFKPEKFQEDALIEIGMKDVEIQQELKTAEECIAQRKEELENWYRQQEEANGCVSEHAEEVIKLQRPTNLFKQPKPLTENKTIQSSSYSANLDPVNRIKLHEYICMLNQAELQHLTLQLIADHCQGLDQQSICDISEIARRICDHPVLLKHLENEPIVAEVLLPHLPPWQEMGLYDSAKFEFVHLMLDNLVVSRGEKCAIVAKDQMCLDIIRGYCQCWEVQHIQIENSVQAEDFNTPSPDVTQPPMVALLLASNINEIRLKDCNHMILYNFCTRSVASKLLVLDADTKVYTLITAGCLEEQLFQQQLGNSNSSTSLEDSLRLQVQATKELLGVGLNTLSSWRQWEPPFSESFLKEAFLCDELPNLSFVFSKQDEIVVGSETLFF